MLEIVLGEIEKQIIDRRASILTAQGDSDFLGFCEIFDDFVDQSEKDVTPHTTYSRGVTHFPIDR